MNLPLILLFGVFVVLLLLGAPTYLALLAGGLSYFFLHPEIDAMAVCQKMFSSLDSFVLIAVPLFMIAGNLMNSGGITDRIFNFAKSIVGHLPGGLGHVNVISSFIFSGMSGSALADVGGLGQVEIKAMKEENYDDRLRRNFRRIDWCFVPRWTWPRHSHAGRTMRSHSICRNPPALPCPQTCDRKGTLDRAATRCIVAVDADYHHGWHLGRIFYAYRSGHGLHHLLRYHPCAGL